MELPNGCVSIEGEGEPVWKGSPGAAVTGAIGFLTMSSAGRTYYRMAMNEGWRRLRDAPDYDRVNRAIDAYRRKVVGAPRIERGSPGPRPGARPSSYAPRVEEGGRIELPSG